MRADFKAMVPRCSKARMWWMWWMWRGNWDGLSLSAFSTQEDWLSLTISVYKGLIHLYTASGSWKRSGNSNPFARFWSCPATAFVYLCIILHPCYQIFCQRSGFLPGKCCRARCGILLVSYYCGPRKRTVLLKTNVSKHLVRPQANWDTNAL